MGDTLTTMDRLGFPDWTCIAHSGLAIAVSHGAQGSAALHPGLTHVPLSGAAASHPFLLLRNNASANGTSDPRLGQQTL